MLSALRKLRATNSATRISFMIRRTWIAGQDYSFNGE